MATARAMLLALALQSTPVGVSPYARFGRPKTAYFATLLVEPEDYQVVGFVPTDSGVDVLWQNNGSLRLLRDS